MSSLVDTISNAVEDLTTVVGEVGCALSDAVTEQVTSMMNGLHPEEESSSAAEAVDTSQQEDATSPEVSQETPSNGEPTANQRNCYTTSVSPRQDQGTNEERPFKYVNNRQQTLSKCQESNNAGNSVEGHVNDGGISVAEQNTRAGSVCQELGPTDRYRNIGLGMSSNGKNDFKEVRYQEMREKHLKTAENRIKSKGSKGNECSGNENSTKDILASSRHVVRKSIRKEDIHPAPSTSSAGKLRGQSKEHINPTKCYRAKGDTRAKKSEAISAKKGKAKSKDEKDSKIIPGKGEVSYCGFE